MILRVMTYNVRYFGHALPLRGTAATRQGLRGVADALTRLDALPHVICLQEVEARSWRSALSHTPGEPDETQLEALMKSLGNELEEKAWAHHYASHYFPAHAYRIGPACVYTTGLAILVRNDLYVHTHNAEAPEEITHRRNGLAGKMKQSRIVAHLAVDVHGELFDIFNTHLSLPQFMSKTLLRTGGRMGYGANQEREVEQLAEYVDSRRHGDRYVIMGDFNSLPASPAYFRLMRRLGVHDAFADLVGHSPDELRLHWPTAGFMHLRMRLDHIFAGPGVRFLDFEDTHPFGQRDGHWHGLSDHVPILGRCESRTRSEGARAGMHASPA